ncbi:MAG: Hsp20/alpha crystallin family protein [Bacteroidales bacterium]|jgi:HSP20 family protein|nr:Hsp20/alpha crystallin family protein [Bacteroidales bacterium]
MLVRYENKPVLNRLFDDFFSMNDIYKNSIMAKTPAANIIEEEQQFLIEIAAPGLKKDDFKIKMDKLVLNISVEKEQNQEENESNYTKREFSYTSFSRGFNIPETIDVEKIEAAYEKGILIIKLPKKEEAVLKSREIKIS